MRVAPLCVFCIFLAFGPAQAQDSAPQGAADAVIGTGDLLDINVLGVADFTRESRVGSNGTIHMPFLGDVQVQGLTCSQLQAKLASLLSPNYVRDPQVSVSIKEPRRRMFSLMGAVMRPGQFQILEPVTLTSAIANAGGLDLLKVGDKAIIQRTYGIPQNADQPATAQFLQIEVDLKKLLLPGDVSSDLPIMPGDVISIPQRQVSAVYVIGDVNKPGPYDFPAEDGIKLSRALARAGGPTRTAKLKNSALIRQKADGSTDRIAFDLGKVLNGSAPDIDLKPNDLLFVPSSVTKSLGWGTIYTLPSSILTRLVLY